MATDIIIKCKTSKETMKQIEDIKAIHAKGKLTSGSFGKLFIEFCKNTIIIM